MSAAEFACVFVRPPRERLAAAERLVHALPAYVGAPVIRLGMVGGDRLVVEGALDVPVADLAKAWRDGIPSVLRRDAAHFSLSNATA